MTPQDYEHIKELLIALHAEYELKALLGIRVLSKQFDFDNFLITFEIRPSEIINEFLLIVYAQQETWWDFNGRKSCAKSVNKHAMIASYKKLENMINGSSLRTISKTIKRLTHEEPPKRDA